MFVHYQKEKYTFRYYLTKKNFKINQNNIRISNEMRGPKGKRVPQGESWKNFNFCFSGTKLIAEHVEILIFINKSEKNWTGV